VTRTIEDMTLVEHACVVPDSAEHLWEVTAAWVAGGLDAGARVVYFEDETAEKVLRRLHEDHTHVRGALDDGQLSIVPTDATRAALAGSIDSIGDLLQGLCDETVAAGWPGLRLAAECGPGLIRSGGLDKLVAFEQLAGALARDHPIARLLCRYDRRYLDDAAVQAVRTCHEVELVTPAAYDDTLLRITHTGPATMRLAGEVDHSNRLQIRRLLSTMLDDALRSSSAPTDITLDLTSLRFVDVAGAVGLVHAAEEFPSTHRLVLVGVRPRIVRVLDRCGAPFAEQLRIVAADA
jgi:anti-anti-sigma factor